MGNFTNVDLVEFTLVCITLAVSSLFSGGARPPEKEQFVMSV